MVARAFAAVLLFLVVAAPAEAAAPRPAPPRIVGAWEVLPGGTLRVVDVVRNRSRRSTARTKTEFLLRRERFADLALGARTVPRLRRRRASRRLVTLRVPAEIEPGLWRLFACVKRRCRPAALRVNIPFRAAAATGPPAGEAPTPIVRGAVTILPGTAGNPTEVRDCGPTIPANTAPAAGFTDMLADATGGWTGGDATFSARLPDGRTAWLFGDTFIAGLTESGGRDKTAPDIRNSLVLQGDCLTTRFGGTIVSPRSFERTADDPQGTWYWPNAIVVHGEQIRTFWTRMTKAADLFVVDGVVLASYDLGFRLDDVDEEIPALPNQWWGAAIVDDVPSGHTYVFGIQDVAPLTKSVVLARTPLRDLDGPWEYRTATGWSDQVAAASPVLVDVGHVSTQLSVLRDGAGWALVSQDVLGGVVNVWHAPTIDGSWGSRQTLTTLPPVAGGRTYNALVHPQFTSGDGLLVSYNVFPDTPAQGTADAALYRPRFIRAALP